jgi:zinc/manganese transport system permease protein
MAFYLLFAVTVTASVQVVGVYLVFASLIIPALSAGDRLPRAFGIGVAGYVAGLLASAVFDLPAGAAIVLALALIGSAAALLLRPWTSRQA